MTTSPKTPRQERIEAALARTTDRRLWRLLNKAWWIEFFAQKASGGLCDRPQTFQPVTNQVDESARANVEATQ